MTREGMTLRRSAPFSGVAPFSCLMLVAVPQAEAQLFSISSSRPQSRRLHTSAAMAKGDRQRRF